MRESDPIGGVRVVELIRLAGTVPNGDMAWAIDISVEI